MKKFLPLLLLLTLPFAFASCEDDPWEAEMMGEYWSDDYNSVHFVLRPNKTGYVEYADGFGFEFSWWATQRYLHFTPYDYTIGSFECEYRWTRGGKLVIYDFDEWGSLHLWPEVFFRNKKTQLPTP